MTGPRYINLTVYPETDEELLKASETLSRASAGLALDNIHSFISMGALDEEEV